jgi:hypothetical protein
MTTLPIPSVGVVEIGADGSATIDSEQTTG